MVELHWEQIKCGPNAFSWLNFPLSISSFFQKKHQFIIKVVEVMVAVFARIRYFRVFKVARTELLKSNLGNLATHSNLYEVERDARGRIKGDIVTWYFDMPAGE